MHSPAISLIVPALTNPQRHRWLEDPHVCSLYELFGTLPDPRRKTGTREEGRYRLTCLVAAVLWNCNSTRAGAQWCREQRPLVEQLCGPRTGMCPSASWYRGLLLRRSAEHLQWALADWLRVTRQGKADEPITLDDTRRRGATNGEQKAPHRLSVCTHHTQELLAQVRVGEQTTEIPLNLGLTSPRWPNSPAGSRFVGRARPPGTSLISSRPFLLFRLLPSACSPWFGDTGVSSMRCIPFETSPVGRTAPACGLAMLLR